MLTLLMLIQAIKTGFIFGFFVLFGLVLFFNNCRFCLFLLTECSVL